MTDRYSDRVDAILLDIEGTTTPVDYVFGVLFPFARDHLEDFLQAHGLEEPVQADLALLREEYEQEEPGASGAELPAWGDQPEAAIPYIRHLIAIDRKSTGLKSLQGKIWNQGYTDGTLRSQIFADVPPAFKRWTESGKQLFIFSSGSVQAQQLLFHNTDAGDLTPYLSGYFDTTTGSKRELESYREIAREMGHPADRILFISDVVAELRAAQAAGMQTLFSSRPGNHTSDSEGFSLVTSFETV